MMNTKAQSDLFLMGIIIALLILVCIYGALTQTEISEQHTGIIEGKYQGTEAFLGDVYYFKINESGNTVITSTLNVETYIMYDVGDEYTWNETVKVRR